MLGALPVVHPQHYHLTQSQHAGRQPAETTENEYTTDSTQQLHFTYFNNEQQT